MRLLVTGGRDWRGGGVIRSWLVRLRPAVVIEGEARGADLLARREAEALGIEVAAFPAQWALWGRAAGPRRNQLMLDLGRPTAALAFHGALAHSTGTADMVRRALRAALPVLHVTPDGSGAVVWWEDGMFRWAAERLAAPG